MQDYDIDNYEFCDQNITKSRFNGVKRVSDIEWICKTCHRSLLNRKLPYAYLLNCKYPLIERFNHHVFHLWDRIMQSILTGMKIIWYPKFYGILLFFQSREINTVDGNKVQPSETFLY